MRNEPERDRYWRLVLHAPVIAAGAQPGQFVMLTPSQGDEPALILPRPMAVFDAAPGTGEITIVYAVVGRGTRLLTTVAPGQRMVTVGPLGRPFGPLPGQGSVLLLGRGVGICSLTLLGLRCAQRGIGVSAVSSGRTRQSVIGTGHYARSGVLTREVYDEDGSSDVAALVRELRAAHSRSAPAMIAVCGSRRLISAAVRLSRDWGSEVQASVEAPMACGLGYCHGCATGERTPSAESPLVCRDGPVFQCF